MPRQPRPASDRAAAPLLVIDANPETNAGAEIDANPDTDADTDEAARRATHAATRDPSVEEVIAGRYAVVKVIGRGNQGTTYLCHDLDHDRAPLVLKALDTRLLDDWKSVELFEREAKALSCLDHPAIPGYVDAFNVDEDGVTRLFIAQTFVEGSNLASLLAEGTLRLNEAQAREMARELLEVLSYIHGFSPPIIHRDIKPSNIVRDLSGRLHLIDFGAAQTVLTDRTGGSTVVGTHGYMPFEQLIGRAQPASDLYALGVTLIHLLSHVHPADLPMAHMHLQYREQTNLSPGFCDWLDHLISPQVEARFQSAQEALAALRQEPQAPEHPDTAPPSPPRPHRARRGHDTEESNGGVSQWMDALYDGERVARPSRSRSQVSRGDQLVQVHVPRTGVIDPKRFGKRVAQTFIGGFAIAIMIGVVLVLLGGPSAGFGWVLISVGVIFVMMILSLSGGSHLEPEASEPTTLRFTPEHLELRRGHDGAERFDRLSPDDIEVIDLHAMGDHGYIALRTRADAFLHLLFAHPRPELLWIACLIRDWQAAARDSSFEAFDALFSQLAPDLEPSG